jgi:hypothetical protein
MSNIRVPIQPRPDSSGTRGSGTRAKLPGTIVRRRLTMAGLAQGRPHLRSVAIRSALCGPDEETSLREITSPGRFRLGLKGTLDLLIGGSNPCVPVQVSNEATNGRLKIEMSIANYPFDAT